MTKFDLKKVSIVIPTFNRSDYLKNCIESAIKQTYQCEIVVCDHGSTDDTPKMIEQFSDKVKYIRREQDYGVHFCWLEGVLNATSDYIHLNYDDDWIEPTFIEECMDLFHNDVGFVFSNAKIYSEDENKFLYNLFDFFGETGIVSSKSIAKFSSKSLISPGCVIFRKDYLLNNLFIGDIPFSNFHYKGVGPDLLFSLMATLDYKNFGFVKSPLAIFRSHKGSITIDASKDELKQKKLGQGYEQARKYYFINHIFKKYHLANLFYLIFRIKRRIIK